MYGEANLILIKFEKGDFHEKTQQQVKANVLGVKTV